MISNFYELNINILRISQNYRSQPKLQYSLIYLIFEISSRDYDVYANVANYIQINAM